MVLCIYIYSSPYIWKLVLHALHYIMNISITVQSRVLKAAEVQNSRRWEGITGKHQCVLTLFVQSFAKRLAFGCSQKQDMGRYWVWPSTDILTFLCKYYFIIIINTSKILSYNNKLILCSVWALQGQSWHGMSASWMLYISVPEKQTLAYVGIQTRWISLPLCL